MNIQLPYGKSHLSFQLPSSYDITLIEPVFIPGFQDPQEALRAALTQPLGCPPLKEQVKTTDKIGIIFNDITRATPSNIIIHAILEQLSHVPDENIRLFNALGTHRLNTSEEIRSILGDELVDRFQVIQNNAFDPSTQIHTGATLRGNEIWLNRELCNCDFKILTGFIEPHFFAGYSGGGKAIMPGMAGITTIHKNHEAQMIGHPQSTWGITQGNPIWEEVREVALKSGPLFLVNVTLNKEKQITGIYCGDLDQAHAAGCAFMKQTSTVPVDGLFDIVITSNSGYPLDLNVYQTVKGMSAAAQVVCPGGSILIAAECWDGLPQHGMYGQILKSSPNPAAMLDQILTSETVLQDQWQAQVQAMVQQKAQVYLYSEKLTDEQIQSALLIPCRDIETTVTELMRRYGPAARICVLPEGPQTIPYTVA